MKISRTAPPEKVKKIYAVKCTNGKVYVSDVPVEELYDGSRRHYQEVLGTAKGKIYEDKDRGVTWDINKLKAIQIAKDMINENVRYLREGMSKAKPQSSSLWGIVRGSGGVYVKSVRTGGTQNQVKAYEAAIAEVQQNLSELNRGEYSAIGDKKRRR